MITITPNTTPVAPQNQANRFQQNGTVPQRFQNPVRQNFFQPFRAYRQAGNGPLIFDPEFDGKRLRKSAMRKTVDYNAAIIKMLEARVWQRDFRDRRSLQPDAMYIPDLMPPSTYDDNPINAVTTRFVKTATNKMRCPIFCMAWTPEGRRLVTGASSGEFTLWNGLTFNFETILQAHDTPVRTMVWSHNEMWMVTADHAGYVKYWQSNMNNVKMFMAHQDAIRGISFSPLDSKFASCSDDGTIKIWDFYRCQEERTLRGHGADVKCVHWHPQKALIISGSKDNQQPVKLWDPKTGTSLSTIHAHKSTVMDVKWNDNGNWFVTASRDHLLKLFDIRNLSTEVQVFRGHKKEASSVAWHPIHEGLFCSGGSDGAILFWHVGAEKEVGAIEQAHDSIVWTLAWHPMGHILCSGSNDHTSKFWTRNRPGDTMRDKYNLNTVPASLSGLDDLEIDEVQSVIPGMGPEDKVEVNTSPLPGLTPGSIPGLDDLDITPDEKGKPPSKKVPYSKPIPKNFQAQWNETGKLDDIAGSVLYNTIKEGSEKLMKFLNSGAVKELRDVIPHYDDNEMCFDDDDDDDDNNDAEDAEEKKTDKELEDQNNEVVPMVLDDESSKSGFIPSPTPPPHFGGMDSGRAASVGSNSLGSGPRTTFGGFAGGDRGFPTNNFNQGGFDREPVPGGYRDRDREQYDRERRSGGYWDRERERGDGDWGGDYGDLRSEDSREPWGEEDEPPEINFRDRRENDRRDYRRGSNWRGRRGRFRGNRSVRGLSH